MASSGRSSISKIAQAYCFQLQRRRLSLKPSYSSSAKAHRPETNFGGDDNDPAVPITGISRPLSEVLKDLNKKVPDSLIKSRTEEDFSIRYIPWHILIRILNLYAPEWSGEVRGITYSADGNSVSVVYRVTLYGTDAEIFREATGSAPISDTSYGGPVQKAEAMAFRRACARLGLGLQLYHEELE
ncbi:hypothetical protein OROGR_004948 [Orobanche gracilis]